MKIIPSLLNQCCLLLGYCLQISHASIMQLYLHLCILGKNNHCPLLSFLLTHLMSCNQTLYIYHELQSDLVHMSRAAIRPCTYIMSCNQTLYIYHELQSDFVHMSRAAIRLCTHVKSCNQTLYIRHELQSDFVHMS